MRLKTGKLVNCIICQKKFYRAKWRLKFNKKYFCSYNCYHISLKGNKNALNHKVTKKHREKLRIINTGKIVDDKIRLKISKTTQGKNNHFYGKKHTKKTKQKISKKNKGKTHSEETKQKIRKTLKKLRSIPINCPTYIDGRTPLHIMIHNLEKYKIWRNKVFKRDNYKCQKCEDNKGGNLEAHHKKRFSIILNEFLQQYSQFSPIEDKETLVRLAITYEPFWDVNNGITLCEKCHKKIHKRIGV